MLRCWLRSFSWSGGVTRSTHALRYNAVTNKASCLPSGVVSMTCSPKTG